MTTFRGNQAAQEALYVGPQDPTQPAPIKILTFRRGSGTFFSEFQRFMQDLNVKEITHMVQSESDGNITLTCSWR